MREALGGGEVRLFDEAAACMHSLDASEYRASLYVAVTDVRSAGLDAERHQPPLLGSGKAAHHGAMKLPRLGNDMIGTLHQHQRVGIVRQQPERSCCNGGGGG